MERDFFLFYLGLIDIYKNAFLKTLQHLDRVVKFALFI